jgi:hypothetical protein
MKSSVVTTGEIIFVKRGCLRNCFTIARIAGSVKELPVYYSLWAAVFCILLTASSCLCVTRGELHILRISWAVVNQIFTLQWVPMQSHQHFKRANWPHYISRDNVWPCLRYSAWQHTSDDCRANSKNYKRAQRSVQVIQYHLHPVLTLHERSGDIYKGETICNWNVAAASRPILSQYAFPLDLSWSFDIFYRSLQLLVLPSGCLGPSWVRYLPSRCMSSLLTRLHHHLPVNRKGLVVQCTLNLALWSKIETYFVRSIGLQIISGIPQFLLCANHAAIPLRPMQLVEQIRH